MDKENLVIGIHGAEELVGGHYNVLSSFGAGLLKGFQNNGVKAYPVIECIEKSISMSFTMSFNVFGHPIWFKCLENNLPNIMWNVDSVFYQNTEVIEKFYKNPHFTLFNVSPSDNEAIQEFYPELRHAYFPHAVDLELWKKQDVKKEYDIVFLSSIQDYEAKIEELRQTLPKESFELLKIIYDTWVSASNLSFWQIYQIFKKEGGLNLDVNQYKFMFKNLAYLVSYTKRAQMIESLKDFNVKVFGDGPWEKYAKGNVEYMGPCDLLESINVVNKAKIVLHNHPTQLSQGLHERVLNASAVETFVLSTKNRSIVSDFGDNFGYFGPNFEDLIPNLEYYLKNDEERMTKAQNSRKIVAENHTWDIRAKQIMGMIS